MYVLSENVLLILYADQGAQFLQHMLIRSIIYNTLKESTLEITPHSQLANRKIGKLFYHQGFPC